MSQSCAPFELETCSIVVSWLNSVSEGRHQKVETHQDLLNFASAFVKFCSVSLPEETFTDLVNSVCRVYRYGGRQAGSAAEGDGGGGGGGGVGGGGKFGGVGDVGGERLLDKGLQLSGRTASAPNSFDMLNFVDPLKSHANGGERVELRI